MCENDTVDKKSEGQQAVITPAVSTGSGGVAKIFILTPEILQTLGLTGYANSRITSRDRTKTIEFTIPLVNGVQGNVVKKEDKKSATKIGKLVEESIGSNDVINKPRRGSVSAENSNETAGTSKSSLPSSMEAEQRLSGESPKKSVINITVEVPEICEKDQSRSIGLTTPKAKKIRRKSNAADLPSSQRQELKCNNAVDTKNELEQAVLGVRTSKRVAKPKKFDDYILTENLLSYGRVATNDTASEKPPSRRSSLNSESSEATTKSSKKGSEKIKRKEKPEAIGVGVEDETILKKTVEGAVSKQENSEGIAILSPPKNCFTVPEPPTTFRKKLFDKRHDKESPRAMTIAKSLKPKEKILSKKSVVVADFEQQSSEARNSLPFREDNFVVPKSPIIVSRKKFRKANQAPNLGEKSRVENAEVVERRLKKGLELSASERESSETKKSLSTDIVDRKNEPAKSLTTGTAESLRSTPKIYRTAKPDPSNSVHKTEEISSSKTDVTISSDERNRERVSKSIPRRSIDKKDKTSGSKSDSLRPSDKEEKIIASKSNPLRSADKNKKAVGSELFSVKSTDKKSEASDTSSDPLRSPVDREEVCGSGTILRKTSDKSEVTIFSKLHSPRSPRKKEEANCSKSDPLRTLDKKGDACISRIDSPMSSDKKEEVSISQFNSPMSSDKKEEVSISPLATPKFTDKIEKVNIFQFALPRSPDKKKELTISHLASPMTPEKPREVRNAQPNQLTSPMIKEVTIVNSPSSPVKTRVDSESFNIKMEEDPVKAQISSDSFNIEMEETPVKTQISSESFNIEMEEAPAKPKISSESFNIEMEEAPVKTQISSESFNIEMEEDPIKSEVSSESSNIKMEEDPVKIQLSSEIFTIEMEDDSTDNHNSFEKIEIPSCKIEDHFATNTSLNEASTLESIIVDDAISAVTAPEKIMDSPIQVKTYSRRGRSRRSSILPESPLVLETDVPKKAESTEAVENPVKNTSRTTRRSVQRNENVTDGKGLSEGSEDESEKNEVKPRRRGRPPSAATWGSRKGRGRGRGRPQMDTEYVPRAPSANKEKTKTEETASLDNTQQPEEIAETVEGPKASEVECGKCKERMEKKVWTKHNLMKHNSMAWLSGDPEPDWETNLKQWRGMLMAILKKKKKNQLICETCGVGKRSANGFISHLQFCGKTEDERLSLMMTCPVCNHTMMPSSMEIHERVHRQDEKTVKEKKEPIVIPPSSTRLKRKAAEKAATKILEFTDLVKEDEPATKKRRRTKEELVELIEKPRLFGNASNRWKGMWKNEIATTGKALCRQPGCTFAADSFELIYNHNSACTFAPRSNYVCKLCLFSSATEEEAMKHVEAEHSVGRSTGIEDSDFENTPGSSSSADTDSELSDTKPTSFKRDDRYQTPDYNVKFLDEEVKVDSRWPFTYPPALRWTMEFECKNYRLRLFEDLPPNSMTLLEQEESLEYVPELSRSMQIRESEARGSTPARWTHWERFEGTVTAGIPTFFAGGPVWAIAWLPIPAPMYDRAVDQFVAVSTHPTMESAYTVGKSYVGKNVIQIWNLGPMDHSKSAISAPILSYGVAHDKGTIWCMEWCPSGCYEDSILLDSEEDSEESTGKRRMGLLAAACSDGCVHVFSLPFPEELEFEKNDEDSRLPIYETKPILTLTISSHMYDQGEQNWQCTKLNWCKELGHDTIIAGFSNGHVAMWDLKSKSPLFVTTRGETTSIDAFHHFYAHGHAVSAVQMIPYGDKRFFITSSYDRMTKLWDLEDTSFPVTGLKRGIAVDGAWFTHWPAYVAAYDDVLIHAHTYLLSLRQPGPKIFPLLPTNSPTYSVATSDFGNSVGHGTLAGEVVVMFPFHLWSLKDMERLAYKKRWLASTVEVVDFQSETSGSKKKKPGKEYEYMPETYDGCKDRYGLVFRDKLNQAKRYSRKSRSKSAFSDKLQAVNVEQYPFASANRVSWNPNAWSYLWICVAYQNGLVRFLNFNAVSLDKELRKLLPSHARTMLNETRTLNSNSAVNLDTIDPNDSQMDS